MENNNDLEQEIINTSNRLNQLQNIMNSNTNNIQIMSELTSSLTERLHELETIITARQSLESFIDERPINIITSILNQELINSALDDMEETFNRSLSYIDSALTVNNVLSDVENVLNDDPNEKNIRILNNNTTEVDRNSNQCNICYESTNSVVYKCNECSFITHTKCILQAFKYNAVQCPQCKRRYYE